MTIPGEYGLGRIESPRDDRDLMFPFSRALNPALSLPRYHYWHPGRILDQGATPHCVGYAGAHLRHYSPVRVEATSETADELYRLCKQIDGIPNQPGTYVRTLAKVLKRDGDISVYLWAQSMQEMREWVLTKGPVVVGTVWTQDMFRPDERGFISPTGSAAGGHAYIVRGHNREEGKWRISNSWGRGWGQNGHAWLTDEALEYLLFGARWRGEAMAATELPE